MATRQQLEAQLVAAHRSGNVAAAQQAAYAIRAFDQNSLMAQVPTVNAPAVNRPVQPRWDDMLTQFSQGLGSGIKSQLQGVGQIVTQPVESAKALYQAGVEAFRDPAKALGEAWSGIRSTAERATSSPMGFGQVLGENVNIVRMPGGRRQPTQAELDVYHGTPHTFDPETGAPLGRFRSEKIGTGEGAQAYGYGLYLAEDPKVAKDYKVALEKTNTLINGKPVLPGNPDFAAATQISVYGYDNALQKAINDSTAEWLTPEGRQQQLVHAERIRNLKDAKITEEKTGRVYKVDLPDAKIEQMLDWDKPISQQPAMQKAFNKFWKGLSKNERAQAVFDEFGDYDLAEQMAKSPGEMHGRFAYTLMTHHFGDQAAASDFLRQQGIPGIKYLDAGSRDGGKGTRNFVVFPGEEQNLTILERDGVKAEVPKPDELAYHGTTKQAAAAIEREGFDLTRAADGTVWFTSNPNIGEVAATGKGGIVARSVSGLKLGGWDEMDKYSTDELIAKGYDGLRLKDGDEITYQIFNPEKLKVPTKKAK